MTCHRWGVLLLSLAVMASTTLAEAQDEKSVVARTLNDYVAALSSLDPQRLLPYYHEPLMIVTAARTLVLTTRTDVEVWLKPFIQRLKDQGWDTRSEWAQLHVKQLSAGVAVASALILRHKADGQLLERVGVTYVLRKTSDGWKIAVLVAHDPGSVMSLD